MATAACTMPENISDHKMSPESKELHVLAVDDSLVDRKVIERLLKISSCKVTAVESGSSALQYLGLDGEKSSVNFDDLKVNLIITDYSMPGMTGYELLKKLKTSSALRKIPVVIMSSENIMTRIDRCLEEGAEDFLVKPVKLSDVKRLKDYILKGEGNNKENAVDKRKINDDPSSVQPTRKDEEDPSSVLPPSSVQPTRKDEEEDPSSVLSPSSVQPTRKDEEDPSSVLSPSSVHPTRKDEEDPSSVLPPSQLLPEHLSCDLSVSTLAFSSSESSSKRPRYN